MIVTVLPGIATCAVLVLDPGEDDEEPLVVYWEPLHHLIDGPGLFDVAMRSARVHRLVLDVVVERHTPTVLVVGPQADDRESRMVVEAVRYVLQELALSRDVRLMTLPTLDDVLEALREALPRSAPERKGLRRWVCRRVDGLPDRPNRRQVLAAAASLAGHFALEREMSLART